MASKEATARAELFLAGTVTGFEVPSEICSTQGFVVPIKAAKTEETRQRRIEKAVNDWQQENLNSLIMAKVIRLSDSEQVNEYIKKLEPSIGKIVETIRQIILSTDKEIGERIKWNNPSCYYTGEMKPFDPKEYKREIVVFNLFKGRIMLVLPSGAKVMDKSGLLEGDYKDGRRLITFKDVKDVKAKEKALRKVIEDWLKLVDK